MVSRTIRVSTVRGFLALSVFVLLSGQTLIAQDWPKFHKDLAQTGYTTAKAPPTNNIIWTYDTKGAVFASPVVVDNRVFVGSENGNMYSLDKYTGALKWMYETHSPIHSTAAVAGGMVYFLAEDGRVYALNANTGVLVWSTFVGDGPWDWSSPAVSGGFVFVASSAGSLYKLSAATGAIQWSTFVGGSPNSMIAVADGKVFTGTHNFGMGSPTLVAVNEATGAIVWNYDYHTWHFGIVGMINANGATIVDGDGDGSPEAYFGVYNWYGVGPQLVSLREVPGTEKWAASIGGHSTSTPAFHGGKLFIGSDDFRLYAVDASTHAVAWTFATGAPILSSPAVSGDGMVCFGSQDHKVYCVDEGTGALKWNYDTGASRMQSSPAISDSILFIGNENGKVYAFSSMPAPVDVKPGSCPNPLNVKEQGVISVAIAGSAGFNVQTVDPASIRLEGVPPIRWSVEDVTTPYLPLLGKSSTRDCAETGPDGYLDLVFKFDVPALVAALGPVVDGQALVLQLTGNLKAASGGTAIRGEDVILILKKGK